MTRHRYTHRHRADEPHWTPPGALTQMCHRCDALFYAPRILDHCPACAAAVADEIRESEATFDAKTANFRPEITEKSAEITPETSC